MINWTPSNKSAIVKTWSFKSKSNPSKMHETRLYADGSSSCNCSGWTRHTDDIGCRSCTHVKDVESGSADQTCVSYNDFNGKIATEPAQFSKGQFIKVIKLDSLLESQGWKIGARAQVLSAEGYPAWISIKRVSDGYHNSYPPDLFADSSSVPKSKPVVTVPKPAPLSIPVVRNVQWV
jgi:hypothetical protein